MSVTDPKLGWWRRQGSPKRGFRYVGVTGRPLTSERALTRIRSLVIPPAWTEVHISPDPKRKVQAWGYDKAGRKQYRYSAEHVAGGDRRKWKRLLRVGLALPRLREVTNEHLKRAELDREKVLATVVRLMARAHFRAGSERYAVENRTFGICTLSKKNVRIEGESLVFTYVGKRRKDQRQVVADTPLVEILHELMELPGRRLFQYRAEDESGRKVLKPVTAAAVNRYLRETLGERITSKDLRTFGGTVRASTILADLGPPKGDREATRNVVLATKLVAHDLGNTPAICRKAYIHPAVLEEYERAGRTVADVRSRSGARQVAAAKRGSAKKTSRGKRPKRDRRRRERVSTEEQVGLYPEEIALLGFLERYG
jgi:DNA topoisomerase I